MNSSCQIKADHTLRKDEIGKSPITSGLESALEPIFE